MTTRRARTTLAILIALFAAEPAAAEEVASKPKAPQSTLAVVGEDGLKIEPAWRPLDPSPDLDSILVESDARDHAWLYPEPESLRIESLLGAAVLPRKGALALRPARFRLRRDPVAVLEFESRAAIVRWSVLVVDPEGATVRRFEGSGRLPGRLSWDGRDAAGRPVPVGRTYSVHVVAHDRAGNAATISGDPVPIEGLLWFENTRPRVDLPPDQVVEWGRSKPFVSTTGRGLLEEAADALKSAHDAKIAVIVEGADLARAEQAASVVADFLASDLLRPRSDLVVEARPSDPARAALLRVETR